MSYRCTRLFRSVFLMHFTQSGSKRGYILSFRWARACFFIRVEASESVREVWCGGWGWAGHWERLHDFDGRRVRIYWELERLHVTSCNMGIKQYYSMKVIGVMMEMRNNCCNMVNHNPSTSLIESYPLGPLADIFPLKVTARPWKLMVWKTIVSFWDAIVSIGTKGYCWWFRHPLFTSWGW